MRTKSPNGVDAPFKPALAYRGLTPLYDPLVRWTTSERTFRAMLASQVDATAARGARILDLGCGTGTFALELERRRPDLAIVGLDADPAALALARGKGERARSSISWESGRAERLPIGEARFDAVTSSLFFHHLAPAAKLEVAREIRRVLVPGGRLHVADWTAPRGVRSSLGFFLVQLLDGFATTGEHRAGRLAERFVEAGFAEVESAATLDVPLGVIGFWRARRASEPATSSPGG